MGEDKIRMSVKQAAEKDAKIRKDPNHLIKGILRRFGESQNVK